MLEREQALRILRDAGCSKEVIEHSLAVEREALKLAKKAIENSHPVNLELVKLGSILHDLGRSRTHGIEHGLEGAKILRKLGLKEFSKFAENHIGAGIPAKEARRLGLPARDFIPTSLEEKIVAYADKLVMGNKVVPHEKVLQWIASELGVRHPAIDRFQRLHEEIASIVGGINKT